MFNNLQHRYIHNVLFMFIKAISFCFFGFQSLIILTLMHISNISCEKHEHEQFCLHAQQNEIFVYYGKISCFICVIFSTTYYVPLFIWKFLENERIANLVSLSLDEISSKIKKSLKKNNVLYYKFIFCEFLLVVIYLMYVYSYFDF